MMRNYTKLETVLQALRQHPNGATSKELAALLGIRHKTVSVQLSKAFLWGKGVDRTPRPLPGPAGAHIEYVWRVA